MIQAAADPGTIRAARRAASIRARILAEKPQRRRWIGMQQPRTDARSLAASAGEPWAVRVGRRTRARLEAQRFAVDGWDLLAGRAIEDPGEFPAAEGGSCPDGEWIAARALLDALPSVPGQNGHCEPEVGPLFRLGLAGLRADIARRAAAAPPGRQDAYRAFGEAIAGLVAMIVHAAEAVEAALPAAEADRRAELAAMAASCRRIAAAPPDGFRDAIQLLWFVCLGAAVGDHVGLVMPGRLDHTLLPFYRQDLAAGRLDDAAALELIEALYLLINDQVPDGLAVAVMVGGTGADGADASNPLSYLALEALRRTRLVYPTVGLCWHPGTPAALTELCVELIAEGLATPALFGDRAIRRGMRHHGVPAEECGDYINSACVEITPCGASNVWVASPYFSLGQLLRDELAAQTAPDATPAAAFEDFLAAWRARLEAAVAAGAAQQNTYREQRRCHGGKPLQSVFTRDCVGRGRDIDDGGALYNWVECSFVGLANLADALQVIDQEVYRRRSLSLAGLAAICDADFAGHEAERRRFQGHGCYGDGCTAVETLVVRLTGWMQEACARQRMEPDGSPFVPGAFCWIMHERLGAICGATPDGRRAGAPFADGGGPAQGRERHGPTAGILATTCWDAATWLGGVAYNMKFPRSLFADPASAGRLRDLLLVYLQRGGFEVQVNVVDAATLRLAQAEPEAHRDLVVRIGGYTDYFTRLSPGMQAEVIARSEHAGP